MNRLQRLTLKNTKLLLTINSPDLVSGLHSDPLRNGPVLFLLLGEEALDFESLVGRLENNKERKPIKYFTSANQTDCI